MQLLRQQSAWALLVGLIVFTATTWALRQEDSAPRLATTMNDAALFESVVEQMAGGAAYYPTMGKELRERGYPVASVFNWRQPVVPQFLSSITPSAVRAVLVGIGVMLVVASARLSFSVAASMFHACLPFFLDTRLFLFPELWAGACLGGSAVAFGRNAPRTGVILALIALLIRELAAPYCVVASIHAATRRDWGQVKLWALAAGAYFAFFAVHAALVSAQIAPNDPQPMSWLAFRGLPFSVRTFQLTGLLFILPPFVFALVLGLSTFAWWSLRMPPHVRLGVVAYAFFFMVVGHPFNQYWGLMVAPLFGLWLGYVPDGIAAILAKTRVSCPDHSATPA